TLDQTLDLVVSKAQVLWDRCQALYACSPATTQFFKSSAQSGGGFRLGFTDLVKLKVPKLGDKVGGVFLPNSDKIFIDKRLKTARDACHMLLHELVHRYDTAAYAGGQSLPIEYAAYWHQTAFIDDLLKDTGDLGANMRAHYGAGLNGSLPAGGGQAGPSGGVPIIPYHTRESLLRVVADTYGYTLDTTILSLYPKLPREPEAQASN
ncbi:MAG: hypothetical protein HY075_06635, partial [Deltaproteobacteria bacterium]|nr:hypothetical protein [Deltaproteobacteria bacterium]